MTAIGQIELARLLLRWNIDRFWEFLILLQQHLTITTDNWRSKCLSKKVFAQDISTMFENKMWWITSPIHLLMNTRGSASRAADISCSRTPPGVLCSNISAFAFSSWRSCTRNSWKNVWKNKSTFNNQPKVRSTVITMFLPEPIFSREFCETQVLFAIN